MTDARILPISNPLPDSGSDEETETRERWHQFYLKVQEIAVRIRAEKKAAAMGRGRNEENGKEESPHEQISDGRVVD